MSWGLLLVIQHRVKARGGLKRLLVAWKGIPTFFDVLSIPTGVNSSWESWESSKPIFLFFFSPLRDYIFNFPNFPKIKKIIANNVLQMLLVKMTKEILPPVKVDKIIES